jgi:hypothetical protein
LRLLARAAALPLTAACALADCARPGRARPAPAGGYRPWTAPGRRVGVRERGYGWFSTQGASRYTVYEDAAGRVFEPHEVVNPAFAWLERRGATAGWPVAREQEERALAADGLSDAPTGRVVRLRRAPFVFHLVSVRPAVVVMNPAPPAASGVPNDAPAGAPAAVRARHDAALSAGEIPGLHDARARFVTSVEGAGPPWWFSADLDRPPAPVRMTGADRGEISLPGGRLVLTRPHGGWDVTRE